MAPSRHLNQCLDMFDSALKNTFQRNFKRNSCILINENTFKNFIWKMAAILSRPQCVKTRGMDNRYCNNSLVFKHYHALSFSDIRRVKNSLNKTRRHYHIALLVAIPCIRWGCTIFLMTFEASARNPTEGYRAQIRKPNIYQHVKDIFFIMIAAHRPNLANGLGTNYCWIIFLLR